VQTFFQRKSCISDNYDGFAPQKPATSAQQNMTLGLPQSDRLSSRRRGVAASYQLIGP
jgi:hypothetical protein